MLGIYHKSWWLLLKSLFTWANCLLLLRSSFVLEKRRRPPAVWNKPAAPRKSGFQGENFEETKGDQEGSLPPPLLRPPPKNLWTKDSRSIINCYRLSFHHWRDHTVLYSLMYVLRSFKTQQFCTWKVRDHCGAVVRPTNHHLLSCLVELCLSKNYELWCELQKFARSRPAEISSRILKTTSENLLCHCQGHSWWSREDASVVEQWTSNQRVIESELHRAFQLQRWKMDVFLIKEKKLLLLPAVLSTADKMLKKALWLSLNQ